MTQVAGNRGNQPPYSLLSASRQAGRVHPNKLAGQNAQPVRFGGNPVGNAINNTLQGFVNFSLPTFEKITEVFIWAFLAQDVVAMWLPRIFALLTEGREKYDPKEDPKAKNLPFNQQLSKWIGGNLKGLNWENFKEGTKREFATGPGLLIMPAGLFIAASKMLNSSAKLAFPVLKEMGEGLEAHLKGIAQTPEAYRAAVKEYLAGSFVDPLLQEKHGRALTKWSDRWVENFFQEDSKIKKTTRETLSKELKGTIREFNREHRILPYEKKSAGAPVNQLIEDSHPLHRSEATWVSYRPNEMNNLIEEGNLEKAAHRLRQVPVTEILTDLERMDGLVKAVGEKATGSVPLSDVARGTMEKLVKMKFGLSVGATVITAAYLAKLAFWAQSHGTYQATRFLNEKNAKGHQPTTQKTSTPQQAGANAQSQCLAPTPVVSPIAGSTHALQPAFSTVPLPAQALNVNPFGMAQPGFPLKFGAAKRGEA